MNEQTQRELRYSLLVQEHGTLEVQKDNLITEIVSAFDDPRKWPMTDGERVDLLRSLCTKAVRIRGMESLEEKLGKQTQ